MLQDDFRTLGQLEGHNCRGIRNGLSFYNVRNRAIAPTDTSICSASADGRRHRRHRRQQMHREAIAALVFGTACFNGAAIN
jgi:hypothetical protein